MSPRRRGAPVKRAVARQHKSVPSTVDPLPWQIAAFVMVYRQSFNAVEAAKAAGYSGDTGVASRLLNHEPVQEALQKATLEALHRSNMQTADIIRGLSEIAGLDPAECFGHAVVVPVTKKDGSTTNRFLLRLKDLHEMPLHVRRCIASFKVVKQNLVTGDGDTDDVIEVKFWSKIEALRILAQHRGMLKDIVEHQISVHGLSKLSDEEFDRQDRESRARFERALEARRQLGLLPPAQTGDPQNP